MTMLREITVCPGCEIDSRDLALLIEFDVSAGEDLACGEIQEVVGLLAQSISEHDALACLGAELA